MTERQKQPTLPLFASGNPKLAQEAAKEFGGADPILESTYWLTLAVSAQDLADYMECTLAEIEDGDYIGAIREFGEIVKLEEIEETR